MKASASSAELTLAELTAVGICRRRRPIVHSGHATSRSFLRAFNNDLTESTDAAFLGVVLIVCECGRADCSESLSVSFAAYEAVRMHPARFLVALGHEDGQRVLVNNSSAALIEVGSSSQALGDAGNGEAAAGDQPRRVLVVDDDDAIRMLCSITLEAEGFSVIEASDGNEGLELALSECPDLIVTDVKMPRCDGFTLTETLRREEKTREIPVVFMTGNSDKTHEARARELGAFAFLPKPFNPRALATIALSALV